ncbi:MAG: cobalamin-binding protein [Candidatus Melainabacteria bacterium]|nr:cobalamin-binding protein [Candidatus Melainabacteria bacterium]
MKDPKIVSCSPAHSEIICLLGKQDLIVGKTTYCDFPKDLLKEKPTIGSWMKLNYDAIEKLKPDLIITNNIVQEKIAVKLKDAGFNVYHTDPLTLNQIYSDILEIGKITSAKNEAEKLINKMKSELSEIEKDSKKLVYKQRIYVEEWHDPPTISGNWLPEIVNIAGGNYGLLEAGKRSIPISIDKLFSYNPEKIIISWCGFGEKVDIIQVLNRSGWDLLSAIKNKEIFVIDDSLLNRPGPRIVAGTKKIQEILFKQAIVKTSNK